MADGSLRTFYGWFTVLGLLVGGLIVLGYYKDEYREWKDYQKKFIQEEIRRAATPEAARYCAHVAIRCRWRARRRRRDRGSPARPGAASARPA